MLTQERWTDKQARAESLWRGRNGNGKVVVMSLLAFSRRGSRCKDNIIKRAGLRNSLIRFRPTLVLILQPKMGTGALKTRSPSPLRTHPCGRTITRWAI